MPPASAAAGTTTRCAAVPNASRTEVRNHQADEADGAALDHRARGQQAGQHHDDDAPAREVEPQALRGGLAGGEHVERPRDERHRERG